MEKEALLLPSKSFISAELGPWVYMTILVYENWDLIL